MSAWDYSKGLRVEYNGYVPANGSAGRRWAFLNSPQFRDHFYGARFWPISIAQAMCNDRPNHLARMNVFSFLVGNGMSPEQATRLIVSLHPSLDREARDQINWLAVRVSTPQGRSRTHTAPLGYWDMGSQSYESL